MVAEGLSGVGEHSVEMLPVDTVVGEQSSVGEPDLGDEMGSFVLDC